MFSATASRGPATAPGGSSRSRARARVALSGIWTCCAAELDRPGVGLVDADEDLHQRRLARAVLAHQRVDGAGRDFEVDVVERLDARERLGDARPSGGGRRRPSPASRTLPDDRRPVVGRPGDPHRTRFGGPRAGPPIAVVIGLSRPESGVLGLAVSSEVGHVLRRDELVGDVDEVVGGRSRRWPA